MRRYECTPEEYEDAKKKFSDSQRGRLIKQDSKGRIIGSNG